MTIRENDVKRNFVLLVLAFVSMFVLVGCGSAGSQENSTTGGLQVTLETNPAQPQQGPVELIVDVKDEAGRALDGATVTLKADMIGHSMGDLSGQATGQTNGRYAIGANLSMAGEWQIDVQVKIAETEVQRRFKIMVR